jgi:uncharacterized protein
MKGLIEFLARSLVAYPEQVEVNQRDGENGTLFELSVNREDLGRIIGKKGATIKAIRLVVAAAAAKAKSKVTLVIKE